MNFTNLSRYSELSERTYRRQYQHSFAFVTLNRHLSDQAIAPTAEVIGAIDCSFIPKSGKATYGVDWFYNGSANRSEKGLEISVIAVVDVANHQGYTLSVQQTPPTPLTGAQAPPTSGKGKGKGKGKEKEKKKEKKKEKEKEKKKKKEKEKEKPTIGHQTVKEIQAMLEQLPENPKASHCVDNDSLPAVEAELTRVDHYLKHLEATYREFPSRLKYLVADGFYSKQKFVNGVVALQLHLISKLRVDANLSYLYSGEQKPRGRHRQYDGKVLLNDLSRFSLVESLSPHLSLYTAVVWHVTLKRKIRLALLVDTHNPDKVGYVLLFSTDWELDAKQILEKYRARFSIEFIFRDAKQFTGLCDAQTRNEKKLDFHFNATLTALNLAKYDAQLRHAQTDAQSPAVPFSMASYKRTAFNDHLLERFIIELDLNPSLIKSHPNYQKLRSYGRIAP